MKRTFEHGIDFVDAIEDVKHKINFMSDACMALLSREEALVGEQSISGLYEIFRGIDEELDDLENAIHEKVFEVVESCDAGDPASEKSLKHEKCPRSDLKQSGGPNSRKVA